MKQVFADTSYWIALLNPRDELHRKAIAAAQDYPAEQVVTSEMVLVELLNGFSDHGPRVREAVSRLTSKDNWLAPFFIALPRA